MQQLHYLHIQFTNGLTHRTFPVISQKITDLFLDLFCLFSYADYLLSIFIPRKTRKAILYAQLLFPFEWCQK